MPGRVKVEENLNYLNRKPKKLKWKIIAGPPDVELDYYQSYDLIYDEKDLKLRKMDTEDNLKHFEKLSDKF